MSHPHLTVAVLCLKNDHVLMVNEIDNGVSCWNQPAGHVEVGEDLVSAAEREALEETGCRVEISGISGIYQGVHAQSGTHYVRVCFSAQVIEQTKESLDSDIIEARWLSLNELLAGKYPLRSALARQTLEDAPFGPIYPTSLIHSFSNGAL